MEINPWEYSNPNISRSEELFPLRRGLIMLWQWRPTPSSFIFISSLLAHSGCSWSVYLSLWNVFTKLHFKIISILQDPTLVFYYRVFPPKSHMLKPKPWCDGIWSLDVWKVILGRQSPHEWYQFSDKRPQRAPKRLWSTNQEMGSHQKMNLPRHWIGWHLDLGLSTL